MNSLKEAKEYLTKEKYDELQKELENLRTVRRKEVAEDLEYAKSLGDLSENAEYHEARENQANIEDRISKLEMLLKSAEIMSLHHTDTVTVGSTVSIQKQGEKDKKVYKIVGSEEADVSSGKLSVSSPMGSSMMNKKKGELFSVSTPRGTIEYKIVDLE